MIKLKTYNKFLNDTLTHYTMQGKKFIEILNKLISKNVTDFSAEVAS